MSLLDLIKKNYIELALEKLDENYKSFNICESLEMFLYEDFSPNQIKKFFIYYGR